MKRFTYFFIIYFISMCFFSCQKYDSAIKGKVSYIAYYDQKEYPAYGAVLEKIKMVEDKEEKISAVKVDTNGNYIFDYVTEGEWIIKGQLITEDAIYEGSSSVIKTNGEDMKEVDLVLEFVEMITNE